MTELYHGPWDPVTGDRSRKVKGDPYHPMYPAATEVRVKAQYSQPAKPEQNVARPK